MKTTATPLKSHHKSTRSNKLGSYLAITAGAAAVSLPNADAAIVAYNGVAVTVTRIPEVSSNFLYWGPNAGFDGTVAGAAAVRGPDRFIFQYNNANYLYSTNDENTIKFYLGTVGNAALKLTSGATIDSSTNWWGASTYMNHPGWTTAESPWATGDNGTQGFVPFYFSPSASLGADRYYGWADFTYNNDPSTQSLTLNNFAYNNTPNEAILSGGGAVPEPSTLLLLALGGAGLAVARRLRKEKKTVAPVA